MAAEDKKVVLPAPEPDVLVEAPALTEFVAAPPEPEPAELESVEDEDTDGSLIVFVRLPESSNVTDTILAHTEKMKDFWYLEPTEKLLRRMKDQRQQFFFAEKKKDGSLKLGKYAPWQPWSGM